ncbi:MAG: hypothetical protein KIS76_01060 [Pyrinomonadaceae bacterium]|nr:hypothetical protein [Pyrinomonadaceae bacterium]
METLANVNQKKKGINKIMLGAVAVGFLIIAGAVYLLSFQPTLEEQKAKMLEGALTPGNPDFEKLTKDILFTTDAENTTESPTGLGRIMMTVPATIANKSDKTITLLQVKVVVVNVNNEVVKEKDAIVVPGLQAKILPPNDEIKIVQTIDGFDPKADRAMVRWTVTAIKTE